MMNDLFTTTALDVEAGKTSRNKLLVADETTNQTALSEQLLSRRIYSNVQRTQTVENVASCGMRQTDVPKVVYEKGLSSDHNRLEEPARLDRTGERSAPCTTDAASLSSTGGNMGRWSDEEHKRFLSAFRRHPRRWTKISTLVGTRTPVQVRTHALKYLKKAAGEAKSDEGSLSSLSSLSESEGAGGTTDVAGGPGPEGAAVWSPEEHLRSVLRHGKDWNAIAAKVRTRSAPQVRQRQDEKRAVAREDEGSAAAGGSEPADVSDGTDSEATSVSGGRRAAGTSLPNERRERTGRWTREEHFLFLVAALQHGRDWRGIAAVVGTRTPVQVRTHAQKWYIQKMRRTAQQQQQQGLPAAPSK